MNVLWIVLGTLNLLGCALLYLHIRGYIRIEVRKVNDLSKNRRLVLLLFNYECLYVTRFNNGMHEVVFCFPFKIYLSFTTYITGPGVLEDGSVLHNKFSIGADFFKRMRYFERTFTVFDIRFGWDRYYSVDLSRKEKIWEHYPTWCSKRTATNNKD